MSIYELYRPIAIIGKYLGIAPLSGLYQRGEHRSSPINFILDHGLPAFNFLFQSLYFCLIQYSTLLLYYVSHIRGFDFLDFTVTYFNGVILSPFISLCFYFKSSKLMVDYLRAHTLLDQLIQPEQAQLKRFIAVGYFIALSTTMLSCLMVLYVKRVESAYRNFDIKEWYFPHSFNVVTITLLMGTILMAFTACQAIFSYIAFQHVLTTAFDRLSDSIRAEKGQRSIRQQIKMIRHYSSLYNRLSELSARLNDLFSPVIFVVLAIVMINSVMIISGFKGQRVFESEVMKAKVILAMSVALLKLLSVPLILTTFTSNTVKAAKKVFPALLSSIDVNTKEINSEVEIFGLRVMSRKISFTASGFFTIDREIIHSFMSTIISYSVVAIQIKYLN